MQVDTTITLTRSELLELVRKAYPEIKSICEVRVVEDTLLGMLNKQATEDSNAWIDVPKDWKSCRCPTDYPSGTILDLLFRDGGKDEAEYNEYASFWCQNGGDVDIVKYRVSKHQ